jgi:hypothetical protein
MPNGFTGSQEEWERLEAPLRAVDGLLETYAARHGLSLRKNYHNWPERSLLREAGVRRLIQIYLGEEKKSWNLWICASRTVEGRRYWKRALLLEQVPSSAKGPITCCPRRCSPVSRFVDRTRP